MILYRKKQFQSTPPVKAATCSSYNRRCMLTISIHAAREGGDIKDGGISIVVPKISIHAAREGGDLSPLFIFGSSFYFNPRRP